MEILGACPSITDLLRTVGGKCDVIPKVAQLHKAGLDGILLGNNYLVVRLFLPSDIMTPEDCGNEPRKKTTLDKLLGLALTELVVNSKNVLEQRQEVHDHVKIICKAMYPAPNYSRIFKLGTSAFSMEYLTGKSCIFHVGAASSFGKCVLEGGANGARFVLENPLGKESVRVRIFMISRQF